jgi:Tol biopolymer transport system component
MKNKIGNHNMTVVLFTLLSVLICGSLSLSLKAQTKTSDEHVTPKTVPGRNGKIAFTSSHDGNGEIYTMEADGSNQTRLTNNPGYDISPKWSPDGTKIAFVSSIGFLPYDIYVMNADGSNQTRLTNNRALGEPPDWSPDGTRIVFALESGVGNSFTREIFVVNADGTNQTQLTNSGRNSSPHWSPDGTRIVFYNFFYNFGSTVGIYVMNADGSNQTPLTNSRYDYDPKWSPDSSRITFTSFRDEPSPSTCNNCNVEIYSMNADGSNQTRLTNNPRLDTSPEWSPDGTRIVFRSLRDNNINIYVMNADGTSQTRLTNYTENLDVVSPIFSPDGTRIAFLYGYSFAGELIFSDIYVMNADGSNLVRLTNVYEGGELDWQALPLTSPSCPNPIDCAEFFVRQHYRDFLNREPDAGGLAYWTDQITQCGTDAACVHNRRIDVSAAFFFSLEFQQTGSFVYGLYKGALARQPTYLEFTVDHNRVIGGADLEAEKAALANDFVQRPEFQQHYPGSMTNTQFVNTLFDTASLFPFTAERQAEIDAMNNQGRTRAQVLRNVIDIQAFKDREFNPSFVMMQYFGYMRRDIDPGGYAYWLVILNSTNNYRGMVCNFINSWEYQLRFGAVTRINADCSQ